MARQEEKKAPLGHGIVNPSARPTRIFTDKKGNWWLCDQSIDPKKGFKEQGCWNCTDLPFDCGARNA